MVTVRTSAQAPLLCPGCDLLLTPVEPSPGHTVRCPRCGEKLHKWKKNSVEKTAALSLAGLLLFIPANFLPLLTFDVLGTNSTASLFTSTLSMFSHGEYGVGAMVLFSGFLFPLIVLSLLFSVSFCLYCGCRTPWMADFLKSYQHLTEWAMDDVYLIGVFVTMIKMSHMAEIEFNFGLACFIGLVLITIAAGTNYDRYFFWSLLDQEKQPVFSFDPAARTGAEAGLCLCHGCRKTLPYTPEDLSCCPRCGDELHLRKTNSLSRTWALVLCAMIFTFPANLLPIMEVEYFGVPERSTIMDGIIYFFQEGSYGIGAIILTASILVPLFKIVGLIGLLISIHIQSATRMRHKAAVFRFIEFIGRWSMLDIFVIALLCALVRFGFLSTINPAPAALYFTGVVLSTMFAAIFFDPRMLWDAGTMQPVKTPPQQSHAAT